MKKYLFMFIAGLILLNALASIEVSAQTLKAVKTEIPFDFRIDDKVYPAGVYNLESISRSNENILQLRGIDKKNKRLMVANPLSVDEQQSPKLVFRRIGEEYYLTNIFMTQGAAGFSISAPRRDENSRKLAKAVEVPVTN